MGGTVLTWIKRTAEDKQSTATSRKSEVRILDEADMAGFWRRSKRLVDGTQGMPY